MLTIRPTIYDNDIHPNAKALRERKRRNLVRLKNMMERPSIPGDWKTVVGFPQYDVNEFGDVRRSSVAQRLPLTLLKPVVGSRGGYLTYCLRHNGKQSTLPAHKLVADAFLGVKPFEGACIRHLDGNPLNNNLSNLKWGTYKENADDSTRHGTTQRGTKNPNNKLTEPQVLAIRRRLKRETATSLAAFFGVSKQSILAIKHGKSWMWL